MGIIPGRYRRDLERERAYARNRAENREYSKMRTETSRLRNERRYGGAISALRTISKKPSQKSKPTKQENEKKKQNRFKKARGLMSVLKYR